MLDLGFILGYLTGIVISLLIDIIFRVIEGDVYEREDEHNRKV